MPDKSKQEETALGKYIKAYLASLSSWKETNLPAYHCHRQTALAADKAYHLTADEQKEADAWLDAKFPNRHRKPKEEGGPSAWDDLPSAS